MYGDVSFTCFILQFASVLSESDVGVELAAGYVVPHT
jgi:hypothetical protein